MRRRRESSRVEARFAKVAGELFDDSARIGLVMGAGELSRRCAAKMGLSVARCRRMAERFLSSKPSVARFKQIRRTALDAWSSGYATQYMTVFVDIGFMTQSPKDNDGNVGFLLSCSSWTHLLAAAPVSSRSWASLADAIGKILEACPETRVILSDMEMTFRSDGFAAMVMRRFGVKMELLRGGRMKSFLAERYIGYVRTALSRALEANRTDRWVDYLPVVVAAHNESTVPRTDVRRVDVTRENIHRVMERSLGITDFASIIRTSLANESQISRSRVLSSFFAYSPGDKVLAPVKLVSRSKQKGWIKSSAVGYRSKNVYVIRERRMSTARHSLGAVLTYRISREEGGPALRTWFYERELHRLEDAPQS